MIEYKNLHRIWFGENNRDYSYHFKSCEKYFGDWNVYNWGDHNIDEVYKLINKYDERLVEYFEFYKKYEASILSDILRFIVLYYYGGIYTDYDIEFLSDTYKKMIEKYDYELPIFRFNYKISYYDDLKISPLDNTVILDNDVYDTCIIYSPPKNKLIKKHLDEVIRRLNYKYIPEYAQDVLYISGLHVLSKILHENKNVGYKIFNDKSVLHHMSSAWVESDNYSKDKVFRASIRDNAISNDITIILTYRHEINSKVLDEAKKQNCNIMTYKYGNESIVKSRNKIRKYLLENDKSKYYFWMDEHIVLQYNTVMDLYKMFEVNKELYLVSAWCYYSDNDIKYKCGKIYKNIGLFNDNDMLFKVYDFPILIDFDKDKEVPMNYTHIVDTNCMLMKREVLENIEFNNGGDTKINLNTNNTIKNDELKLNNDLMEKMNSCSVMSCFRGSTVKYLNLEYKNLHRIWFGENDRDCSHHFKSCEKYFGDWKVYNWGDHNIDEAYNLLKRYDERLVEYFEFYYNHKNYKVICSDIFRLVVLYYYGGLYTDYDIEFLSDTYRKKIEEHDYELPIFSNEYVLAGKSRKRISILNGKEFNFKSWYFSAIMYSPKYNKIMKKILDIVMSNVSYKYLFPKVMDLSYHTGPGIVSQVLNDTEEEFFAFPSDQNAEIVHYGFGSWVVKN